MSRWPITWYDDLAEKLDRKYGWDKLPLPIAMVVLIGLRNILREKNLYDTGRGRLDKPTVDDHPRYMTARTLDGTFNNLEDPLMGSLGSRFGRNVPLEYTVKEKDPLEPNPRAVSRELLTRKKFIPATTLNLLAGAWLQFEVHDWFSHGPTSPTNPWQIELDPSDPWPQHPMQIQRTHQADPTADRKPPTFANTETHWWDASQVYGSTPSSQTDAPHRRERQAPARARGPRARRPRPPCATWPASRELVGRAGHLAPRSSCASTTRSATASPRRTRR